jgi:sugar phosphate isomerase/epimerase
VTVAGAGGSAVTTAVDEWRRHWTLPVAAALGYSAAVLHTYTIGAFVAPLQEFGWSRAQMCEIGVPRVNILTLDPDLSRNVDQLAKFPDMAHSRGLQSTLEFLPGLTVCDLPVALAVVRQVNRSHFRVLIDAMHLFRSGSSAADDPSLIGYVQICDIPRVSKTGKYADEARFERLPPGEGELPLAELIKAGVPLQRSLAAFVSATRTLI